MHQLIPALKQDLLQTVYNAYLRLGLFKGNPEDNPVARQWLGAIAVGACQSYSDLNKCLSKHHHLSNALFKYAYLRGAINRRKLSYLLNNPAHRNFILVIISDIQE